MSRPWACTLRECPPGLFLFGEAIGFKSEYAHDNTGSPDAYVVESGEYFWGGESIREMRDKLMVVPIVLTRYAAAPRTET
jgi:hypothetical protein